MIDKLYNIYNYSLRLCTCFKSIRLDSLLRHIVIKFNYYFLPWYFRYTANQKNNKLLNDGALVNGCQIIVSLTSFPIRIRTVWLCIESLLRQKTKPHKIILWLSNEQFISLDDLPNKLLAQRERGLDIRFVDGDIRSHKKYFYSFQEFPNDYVVLVDDDILYPSTFLGELLEGMENKKRVNCSYGCLMQYDKEECLQPYITWKHLLERKIDNKHFFFGSGGGTVFIPSFLYSDCCNIELAYKLCPIADDIWLNAMVRLAGLACVKVRGGLIFEININRDQTLCNMNVTQGQNDIQLANVRNYYIKTIGIDPFAKDL